MPAIERAYVCANASASESAGRCFVMPLTVHIFKGEGLQHGGGAVRANPIPEIKRMWERVAVVLPPSNPTDPADPSINLDTLAAIAHAKWSALVEAEAEIAAQHNECSELEIKCQGR